MHKDITTKIFYSIISNREELETIQIANNTGLVKYIMIYSLNGILGSH